MSHLSSSRYLVLMSPEALIQLSADLVGEFVLSRKSISAATVGAALITDKGNVYTGVNLDLFCGVGVCAEHSAVAEMLKHRETRIQMRVAHRNTGILPPCGRCRELMMQVNAENKATLIILPDREIVPLESLLPNYWSSYLPKSY